MGRHGVGYDQIDVPAATARGIQVVYTPGANTQSVAEHVFALMIGLSRHFPHMIAELAAGNYHARTSMTGREIAGKTLGIIGFGRIGRRVGEIANRGFDMKVVYHDIVPAPPDVEARAGASRAGFREVLESSEYVTLHVPLDASTRGMIDRQALSIMRQDAILINTCRGPVVDEHAVARALDDHRLWGYGADVFTVEPPPPGHPLIGRQDVILTPHSAAQTEEGLRNMATAIAQEVVGVLSGTLPENPVNDPLEVERIRRSSRAARSIDRGDRFVSILNSQVRGERQISTIRWLTQAGTMRQRPFAQLGPGAVEDAAAPTAGRTGRG